MAEPYLSLDAGERADILRTAAANAGRSAVVLDKDIWVCWVLDALFSMPVPPHPMAFKGGTSLSKVCGVIDRFCENVDVILNYRAFGDGSDPFVEKDDRRRPHRLGFVQRFAVQADIQSVGSSRERDYLRICARGVPQEVEDRRRQL